MHSEVLKQVRRGESLLQGLIGELASDYEFIYKQLQTTDLYDPKRQVFGKWLEHLATVAPKVARLYKEWENEVGGDSMYHIIEQLEEMTWWVEGADHAKWPAWKTN